MVQWSASGSGMAVSRARMYASGGRGQFYHFTVVAYNVPRTYVKLIVLLVFMTISPCLRFVEQPTWPGTVNNLQGDANRSVKPFPLLRLLPSSLTRATPATTWPATALSASLPPLLSV